jgi:CDP-4-dehydro-6-deoxyglucose reductase
VYACGAPIVVESAKKAYTELRGLSETSFFADAFITLANQQNTVANA